MFIIEYDSRERGNKGQENQSTLFDVHGGRRRTTVRKNTLGVGDYALWWFNILKVLIERKTWDDLANSIKTGHLDEQLERMQKVREQTECVLIVLVEGHRRAQHGHIDSKCLQAKLDHIMLSGRAVIIYTASVEDTVKRVYELVDNLIVDERNPPVDVNTNTQPQFSEANKILSLTRDHGPDQTQLDCFCAIPQLSIATARVMVDLGWSLWTLYTAETDDIAAITYPSGAKMGKQRAKKISDALDERRVWIKVLEKIHGVTSKTAEKIFKTLPDLNEWSAENVAAVSKTEKTKVGRALADRIMMMLHYKKNK